jgi:hypothetical protein
MGDILSLVEMAESSIKESDAAAMMKKLMEEKFDFNDFLKNYKMVSGMGGGMSSVMKMLPGTFQLHFIRIQTAILSTGFSQRRSPQSEGIMRMRRRGDHAAVDAQSYSQNPYLTQNTHPQSDGGWFSRVQGVFVMLTVDLT